MRTALRTMAAVVALAAGATGRAAAQAAPAAAAPALEQVAWVTGCWEGTAGAQQVEEQWMPLRAGTLVGMARAIRNGRTGSVELTVIRMRGDTLAYHAFPVGQSPTVFPAISVTDSAVVFANPSHDFPQQISYRRVGSDSLVARIEGPGENGPRGFDYHMHRVTCASGAD